MAERDFSWAIPVMRAGYLGRALVYLVVAGFSLYAIWRGGQAEGTTDALAKLEYTPGGNIILFLIFLGMLAYAVWRLVDSIWDLECYGSDAKGWIARIGMIVTGALHLAIGLAAFSLLFTGGGGDNGSSIVKWVDKAMSVPFGRWLVGLGALIVIGAGLFYLYKAWKEKYRDHLRANHFTLHWNPALKAGLAAQGVVIALVGLLFGFAALTADPNRAGGVGEAFSWLSGQPYGRVLVTAVCIGLLGFALFCAVNAAYRIVPRARSESIETLAQRMKAEAERLAT